MCQNHAYKSVIYIKKKQEHFYCYLNLRRAVDRFVVNYYKNKNRYKCFISYIYLIPTNFPTLPPNVDTATIITYLGYQYKNLSG